MIEFTQGDTATLQFTAQDGMGNPINLTGASFTIYFRGPQGMAISFPNAQHTANPDQTDYTGQYTLALASADTMSIPEGYKKEIITQITIGSTVVYYHGVGICNVLTPIPRQ